jgi:UDP-N-acetylmuramoylalanine--D-glutamate ligase
MGRRRTYRRFNFNATVVKSPIPDKASIVKKLVEKGIAVISEIEFAALSQKQLR